MSSPSGRVALVTGGASGIGRAAAHELAKDGFAVVIGDINEAQAKEVAQEIQTAVQGSKVVAIELDVASEESWIKAIDYIERELGGLNALINNAGIGGPRVPIEETSLEDYERTIKVTSTSVFLGCKTASRLLFKRPGEAAVVNVASMMSNIGGIGQIPGYFSAKGAVRTLTKNVAISWAKKGVRSNSVHPGYIDTPLLKSRGGTGASAVQSFKDLTPLGRLGTAEEIANVIAFLAGNKSTFCTGAEFVVDGGYTAQ